MTKEEARRKKIISCRRKNMMDTLFIAVTIICHQVRVLTVMLKSPPPLRTKRNFKALKLPELDLDITQKPVEPLPTRPAPQPGRKRPPPIQADPGLGSPLTAGTPGTGRTRSAIQASLTSHLARLDIMGSPRFDLRNEDLTSLQELGHGNGGSVVKVQHVPSGTIMAKKVCARARPSKLEWPLIYLA